MVNKKVAVIMAGGRGTRLWPVSTPEFPKQFIELSGRRSLIQQTVDRLTEFSTDDIYIVANRAHEAIIDEQLPQIPKSNVIYEPKGRNTAPCIALVVLLLARKYPADTVMAVMPSDHVIGQQGEFAKSIEFAVHQAFENQGLITLGIQPSNPETGYGYIQCEAKGADSLVCLDVIRFVEKPSAATAQKYLDEGNYYWNAGMFVWRLDAVRREFERHAPSIVELLGPLLKMDDKEVGQFVNSHFEKAEAISIDYALMEKSDRVFCIPVDIGWNDIGSWSALEEVSTGTGSNHATCRELVSLDSQGNIVHAPDKVVALIGMTDCVVVESPDGLLVCSKDRAQDVKKVVAALASKAGRSTNPA